MNQMSVLLSSGVSAVGASAEVYKPHTLLSNATISAVWTARPAQKLL